MSAYADMTLLDLQTQATSILYGYAGKESRRMDAYGLSARECADVIAWAAPSMLSADTLFARMFAPEVRAA